jgi:hypothetical protein
MLSGAEFGNLSGREPFVRKMMAKEPSKRPQPMEEFLDDFRMVRVFEIIPKPPAE